MRYTGLFLKTLFAVIAVELCLELVFIYFSTGTAFSILLDTLLLAVFTSPVMYYFLIRELNKLQKERESFRNTGKTTSLILDAIGDGVYGMDLNGNVIFSNRTAAAILGYANSELPGKHSHEVFHHTRADGSPYPAGDCKIYATALDGETRQVSDEVFWKKDGTPLPVEYIATPALEGGKTSGVIVAFKDITDRRRTEREIQMLHAATRIISDAPDFPSALELVLREICENGGWAIGEAFALSRDGERLECTAIWTPEPETTKVFHEASKKTVFRRGEGLPGRVWASLKPEWIENVTTDSNFPRLRAAAEDGLKGAISVPVLADGKFILALDFFSRREIHDLTDFQTDFLPTIAAQIGSRFLLKQADDARKAAQEQLFQGQKMESLGKVAGAIAHDFNNILTGAKGFTALALETLPDSDPAVRFVKETAAGIDRGTELTRQILDFSRNQAADMRELDLNTVIKGMDAMLNMVFQHRIRLKLNLDPDLPAINGNKSQLEQILMNLAVNARDAMPKGGEFSITTLANPAASGKRCPAEHGISGPAVRLSVTDTGTGIPEQVINRVFEPFFTTKPEGKGTGMGLATAYAVVKLHKGGISVTSRPGQGTTFDICIPSASQASPTQQEAQ